MSCFDPTVPAWMGLTALDKSKQRLRHPFTFCSLRRASNDERGRSYKSGSKTMIGKVSMAAALAVMLVGFTPALAARNAGRSAHVSRNVHVKRGVVGRRYGAGIWYGTGRRFWLGQWYPYGVGACWALSPVGYVWICQ